MNTRFTRWFLLLMVVCGLVQNLQSQETKAPPASTDTASIQQKVLDLLVDKLADALKEEDKTVIPDSSIVEESTLPVAEGTNLNFSLDSPSVTEPSSQEEEQQDPADKKADKNKQKAKAAGKKPKSEMRQQKAAQNKQQQHRNGRSPDNKRNEPKKEQNRKKGG